MPTRVNFTKAIINSLPLPASGRQLVYDSKTPDLALRITAAGTGSFQLYCKFKGRPVRVTLGRWPDMTVEQARRHATRAVASVADGVNPAAEKRADRAR